MFRLFCIFYCICANFVCSLTHFFFNFSIEESLMIFIGFLRLLFMQKKWQWIELHRKYWTNSRFQFVPLHRNFDWFQLLISFTQYKVIEVCRMCVCALCNCAYMRKIALILCKYLYAMQNLNLEKNDVGTNLKVCHSNQVHISKVIPDSYELNSQN